MDATITRRNLLLGTSAVLGCSAVAAPLIAAPRRERGFIRRDGTRLMLDREPWRYVGTNPLQGKFTCVESQSARLESGRYLLPIERCAG